MFPYEAFGIYHGHREGGAWGLDEAKQLPALSFAERYIVERFLSFVCIQSGKIYGGVFTTYD